jgi:AcrR family transcriptional regulator
MSAATLTIDEADARIVAAADQLFYPNGVAAITMADIRDSAGVSLRRLYSLYESKGDLITSWLTFRHHEWTHWFETEVATAIAAGRAATDAVFDVLEAWLTETNYRGCGFINTLLEMHELTDEHRSIIETHKAHLIHTLARHSSDPAAMGVLIDGAIVQAAIFQSLEPVSAARRVARVIPTIQQRHEKESIA